MDLGSGNRRVAGGAAVRKYRAPIGGVLSLKRSLATSKSLATRGAAAVAFVARGLRNQE